MTKSPTLFAVAMPLALVAAQAAIAQPANEPAAKEQGGVAVAPAPAKPAIILYADPKSPEQQPLATAVPLVRDAVIAEARTLVPEAPAVGKSATIPVVTAAGRVLTAHRRIRVASMTEATATFVIEDAVQQPGVSEPLHYSSNGIPVSVLLEPGTEFSLDGLNLRLDGGKPSWSVAAEGSFFPWVSKQDKGAALRIGGVEIKPKLN